MGDPPIARGGGRRLDLVLLVVILAAGSALFVARALDDRDQDSTTLLVGRYETGDCVHWQQTGDPASDHDPRIVGCDRPHLVEVTAVVDLSHLGRSPSPEEWDRIVEERCHPATARHLGAEVDNGAMSALTTGRINPRPDSWRGDLRRLVCTVGRRQTDAQLTERDLRPVYRGRAVDQTELDYDVGDCLRLRGRIGTVDCDRPHQAEVTEVVDLSDLAEPPPDEGAWEDLLDPTCAAALDRHLGGRVPADVAIGSLEPTPTQWGTGTRQALCLAGRERGGDWRTVRRPLG